MELVNIPIKDIILSEKNPRKISREQMQRLCKSLEDDPDFLNLRPVLIHEVDGKYHAYAGNQRVQAAKKLKWKEIPCLISKDLSENTINTRMLKDNKTFGEWNNDILLESFDLTMLVDCGFTPEEIKIPDLNADPDCPVEEDSGTLEPGKDEDAETKLGDVYDLNGHRIVCGDSTNKEYVEKCLDGEEPILMVTDPPYGVNYDPSWRKDIKEKHGVAERALGKVQNDDKIDWTIAWDLFPGNIAYVWHASSFTSEVHKSLINAQFKIISSIIWIKQHFALSRGDYHWKHESCWYAVKDGCDHNWQGSRKECTVWEIANLNAFGGKSSDLDERTAHSTQKPIQCMAKPIINNTSKGQGVYDPFLGSGTTLMAAEQLDRICYGIELSPAYCDIIVNRWKKYMIAKNKEFIIKKNGVIQDG